MHLCFQGVSALTFTLTEWVMDRLLNFTHTDQTYISRSIRLQPKDTQYMIYKYHIHFTSSECRSLIVHTSKRPPFSWQSSWHNQRTSGATYSAFNDSTRSKRARREVRAQYTARPFYLFDWFMWQVMNLRAWRSAWDVILRSGRWCYSGCYISDPRWPVCWPDQANPA